MTKPGAHDAGAPDAGVHDAGAHAVAFTHDDAADADTSKFLGVFGLCFKRMTILASRAAGSKLA